MVSDRGSRVSDVIKKVYDKLEMVSDRTSRVSDVIKRVYDKL